MSQVVETPCIGICSTVYGDQVCRGCKRQYQEIIQWNAFSSDDKTQVLNRLEKQLQQILAMHLTISDAALVADYIATQQLRLRKGASLSEQVFHLLRLRAGQIKDLATVGITVKAAYQSLSTHALFEALDAALYALAQQP